MLSRRYRASDDPGAGDAERAHPEPRFTGESDGYKIRFEVPELEVDLASYSVVEQDLELIFDTPSGWVHLRGVKDGLRGTVIRDLKTTKKFSAERYGDAWQWRTYLTMAGPKYRRFDYLVFVVSYGKKQEEALASGRETDVTVREFHQFSCWRYPEMERDLRGVCAELASYLEQIRWEPPPKRQMGIF